MVQKVLIEENALLSALEAAKNLYPNEFIGLFRGEKRGNEASSEIILEELIITPLSEYREGMSSYQPWLMPVAGREIASFHSHPHPPASPSEADKNLFSRFLANFISMPPYTPSSTNAFDANAKKISFTVIK